MRKILVACFMSMVLSAGCATLDGVNLTGVDDRALNQNTNLVLVTVLEMKETDRQGMRKIDGKTVKPGGKYYLAPGKHRLSVRYRQKKTAPWRAGSTTVTLKAGSTYSFTAISSRYGLMTMLIEKSFFIKGRIDRIRRGMTQEEVTKIMKVKPKYTMTVGRKGSPGRSESWSYSNKKERASISYNSNGIVTRTYWSWIKKK